MTSMLKANALSIQAVKPPETGRAVFSIEGVRGLRLFVEPSGTRTWYFEYKVAGRKRRIRLGDTGFKSLAAATKDVLRYRVMLDAGNDPLKGQPAGRRAGSGDFTFSVLFGKWTKAHGHLKGLNERTRALNRDVIPAIGHKRVEDIVKRDIIRIADAVAERGARVHADHVVLYISAVFNWGIDEDLCTLNPAHRIRKRGKAQPRDRVMTDAELALVWTEMQPGGATTLAEITKAAIRMAFLTGQRRGEIVGAAMKEFDLERQYWTIPGNRTKNGKPHQLPMTAQMTAIVQQMAQANPDETYLFPTKEACGHLHHRSLSKAIERFCRRHAIEGVSSHCFRRTMATSLGDLGVTGDVISRLLNHAPKDVTSRHYNHARMLTQMREALELWSQTIDSIASKH